MVQKIRKMAIGATLALSCMACTSGSGNGAAHESTAGKFAPLSQLKSIDAKEARLIAEDEFPPQSQPPKVIGEVRKGAYRLTAYVQGDSCGLRVADATNATRSLIHVTSAWPEKDSEGSTKYPAGPYSFASAAGPSESKTWASLGCSKSAMVIDYSSQDRGSASDQQGSVSFKEHSKVPGTLVVIVGSPEALEKILPQA